MPLFVFFFLSKFIKFFHSSLHQRFFFQLFFVFESKTWKIYKNGTFVSVLWYSPSVVRQKYNRTVNGWKGPQVRTFFVRKMTKKIIIMKGKKRYLMRYQNNVHGYFATTTTTANEKKEEFYNSYVFFLDFLYICRVQEPDPARHDCLLLL